MNSVKNEEDINNLNEDVTFQAKGAFVYGFTEESTKKLKNETMVEIIMGIAKMGLKGDVNCKRMELEKRIIEKEYKINTNNLGIYGGKEAKFGVMVEFFSYIRVGITGGMGIMVYDGRKYEVEGERMHLTRQYMSDKEMEIMKRATAGKQDNMIVAARGMTYKTPLDDVLRRSFKTYLEEELRVKIHVWIMQLRHLDDKGKMRDETIMMGVVAEGAGSRMARSIEVFKKGQKRGMMMMEGIDIQLFRDSKEIWNTKKPTVIGRAERIVEIICPMGSTNATVLKALEEGGISDICMLTRTRQPLGKSDEMWLALPSNGEKVKHRQVEVERKTYVLIEAMRNAESDRIEGCFVNYAKGVKQVAALMIGGGDSIGNEITVRSGEELSSITTSMATTTTNGESEGMSDLVLADRTGAMKDLVENGRREARDMGREIRDEMAAMSKQLSEQNILQDKARMEDVHKQNNTLEELRNMMMQMMQASANKNT